MTYEILHDLGRVKIQQKSPESKEEMPFIFQ